MGILQIVDMLDDGLRRVKVRERPVSVANAVKRSSTSVGKRSDSGMRMT